MNASRKNFELELDRVGGEPLAGSGFEDEVPDPEFSERAIKAISKSCISRGGPQGLGSPHFRLDVN
jgi:hypothetical protein